MRYLVTGANGFVGTPLCKQLRARGWAVRAATRMARPLAEGIETALVGTLDGETNWTNVLDDVDVVVHLAARVHVMHDDAASPLEEFRKTNVAGTEHLARAAAARGVKRLIYVSSVKVNGEATQGEDKFAGSDLPSPQDPYGISKWEAEQALHRVAAETGLEIVIVRPPLVYGPNVKGNFAQMLKFVAKGIPLPLASVQNLRSLIYVENLVDALITCATHPAAAGKTYLVGDGEDVATPDLLSQLSIAMGRAPRLLPCPVALLQLGGRLLGKSEQIERLIGSLRVDSSPIRQELNWTPPFALQQGLRITGDQFVHIAKNAVNVEQ
ncbi:MAG: NAD-dependent epimerase/dehydratase [Herbaspirillum sp.]|nr:NAD-dependent epimerase/dehydratase [Herbaspirillum sp.]